jgi:glycosyltransferase involved in cell wall biosynthesis
VESILSQTWKNLSVIIVNDGSTDDTHDVATDLSKHEKVEYISLDKNMGKWYALNSGSESSTGDYITSQDADDVSLLDRIERQVSCLAATKTFHNLCGFYHCWSESDVSDHKSVRVNGDLHAISHDDVQKLVLEGFAHPSINHYYTGEFETAGVSAIFDRRIWESGLRFNPPGLGLRVLHSEDSDFNFRATALLGSTSVLAEKLYCYRRGTSTNNECV